MKEKILNILEKTGGLRALQWFGGNEGSSLYVLAYHRVDYLDQRRLLELGLISATPEQFAAQMKFIADEFSPVSAEDVLNSVERNAPLPRDAVLVTVDDGYLDYKEYIAPICSRYGIRPILFIPTDYVGGGIFWWDRLEQSLLLTKEKEVKTQFGDFPLQSSAQKQYSITKIGNYVRDQSFQQAKNWVEDLCDELAPGLLDDTRVSLDWDELRELARTGTTVASHTHTHPILSHVPLEQVKQELRESQAIISKEIGSTLPIFAFPDGRPYAMHEDILPILANEGFRVAFTRIEGRANLLKNNLLQMPRLGVSRNMSISSFHLHLTGLYHSWKSIKR